MLTVSPSPPLSGSLALPGDKSLSHRAALFAALAQGESVIDNFLEAGVTRAMLAALENLGFDYQLAAGRLTLRGEGLDGWRARARQTGPVLDCGHSATTMRLLAGALAAAGVPAALDGSAGLRSRPMGRIVEPLQAMGVPVRSTGGKAPLNFKARNGRPLQSQIFDLPVASAQVKSCLLLAGLAADGPVTVIEPGPSRDHTERLLGGMGAEVARMELPGGKFRVELQPPATPLDPLNLSLPGDFSSAAFLIVAGLITPGSEIRLQSVGLNPTRTGLLDALEMMGAGIRLENRRERQGEPVGDILVRHTPLSACRVDGPLVVRMIDEFPAFAVAAAYAVGGTVVREARELRLKESDRISALCRQLRSIGVEARELDDGFCIPGDQKPAGGQVDPSGDHRLAMALAVAGLAAQGPVMVGHPEIIRQSFPGFQEALSGLGAKIDD